MNNEIFFAASSVNELKNKYKFFLVCGFFGFENKLFSYKIKINSGCRRIIFAWNLTDGGCEAIVNEIKNWDLKTKFKN